jgi:hypothetical protein
VRATPTTIRAAMAMERRSRTTRREIAQRAPEMTIR